MKTLSTGPTWLTLTEKPSFSRVCEAWSTDIPSTLGTGIMGGPGRLAALEILKDFKGAA